MAFKKPEEPPKTFPLWQSTFSDLMNLLLCFFVLLFSMSTVEQDKLQQVAQSIDQAFSILPSGGASVSDGVMVSNGISQLPDVANYFGSSLSKAPNDEGDDPNGKAAASGDAKAASKSEDDAKKAVEKEALDESEQMAQEQGRDANPGGAQRSGKASYGQNQLQNAHALRADAGSQKALKPDADSPQCQPADRQQKGSPHQCPLFAHIVTPGGVYAGRKSDRIFPRPVVFKSFTKICLTFLITFDTI